MWVGATTIMVFSGCGIYVLDLEIFGNVALIFIS